MRRFVPVLMLGGAMLAAAAGVRTQEKPAEEPLDPALIERGREVYKAQKCAVCHSIDGVGNKRGPLDDAGDKYTRDELRLWLLEPRKMEDTIGATRRPRMLAYPKLSKEDLDAIVEYMASLREKS
jgi:mono/diheme cytochrome c family protein